MVVNTFPLCYCKARPPHVLKSTGQSSSHNDSLTPFHQNIFQMQNVFHWKYVPLSLSSLRANRIVRFAKTHEWVSLGADSSATIGITDYAQKELGDVVYVELPEVGRTVQKEDAFSVVESVKAASDIMTPLSGTVTEANTELEYAFFFAFVANS